MIDAVGPEVTGLQIGDPAILAAVPDAHARGTYAEYTTVPASRVVARPDGLGITEAAAIWVALSTAYGALFEKAKMRPGDHVLISAASGGVGRAAMQIANQIGAVPLALTRGHREDGRPARRQSRRGDRDRHDGRRRVRPRRHRRGLS